MSSQLTITCVSAQLTRDTQTFSNMDPYVVIQCGSQKRKTRTHQEGGKRPSWNDSFTFINPKSNQLKLAVWDQDTITDDLVGEGILQLSKHLNSPNSLQKQFVTLNYKGRPAGKLCVQIVYKSSNSQNNNRGNNNSQGWNNSQGNNSNSNNSQGWNQNKNPNSEWGNNNNSSQNWDKANNLGSWGNQNSNNQGGYNTNNANNTGSQGWTPSNNQPNNSWGTNPQLNPQQQNNSQPNIPKKSAQNYQVNPYGNLATENQNGPYPSFNDQQKPQNGPVLNPLAMILGANLMGEGQKQQIPPQQQNTKPLNILNKAIQGGVTGLGQQPSGWGQPQQSNGWGQPQQSTGWGQPQQGQQLPPQNNSGWGQPTQQPWQPNKGSNWGTGW